MLEPFRSDFNARFDERKYADLLSALNRKTRTEVQFRVCETPCFFAPDLLDRMVQDGLELTETLLGNPEYMAASEGAIPERFRMPGAGPRPHFMTVDFGFVREADGSVGIRLVELQAFPSIFGYQDLLARQYVESYGLDRELRWLLDGHTEESYWALLGRVLLGEHDPENVVLLEVQPEFQKTLPDFRVYEDRLGIRAVDITTVRQEGKRLFYERDGRLVPIARIFNRAIVDEMEREGITPGFDYRQELEVEWAGHPNWYFRVSKFALPYLRHPSVPRAMFLDQWMDGGRDVLAGERSELLLKPLYSFAGKGIQFAPSDDDLFSIPKAQRSSFLLQQRVHFASLIDTPEGATQAEVRIMYVAEAEGAFVPVISLVRLGRGLMMGVDHNRDRRWVGGSAALFPTT